MSEVKQRGRPSNPNSARNQKLAAKAARIANGETVRPGRTVDPNSKNQQRLAARLARGPVTKGRPKKVVATVE